MNSMMKQSKSATHRSACVICIIVLAVLLVSVETQGQAGPQPFSSGLNFGPASVNLSNLGVHITAPVFRKHGREIGLNYSFAYDDSLLWRRTGSSGGAWVLATNGLGWMRTGPAGWMEVFNTQSNYCSTTNSFFNEIFFGNYTDANGIVHQSQLAVGPANDPCAVHDGDSGALNDGSGLRWVIDQFGNENFQAPDGSVILPIHVKIDGTSITSVGGSIIFSPNGNMVIEEVPPNTNQILDTTNTAFPVTGDYWSPASLGYTDSNGKQQTVSISYLNATLQSNFGCSGISEFPATTFNSQLPTQISYPDATTEKFTYESTPGFASSTTGRIASITLRTGATISFTYSGGANGINCSDATTATLTIQTADGSTTLQHTPGTVTSSTTITDPSGNQMIISFQGGFETQRQIYQGNSTTGTLLETILTCYNGNKTNCATATAPKFPITELTVFDVLPNGQEKEQDTFFDKNSELQTEVDEYDFGSNAAGPLLRKTLTTYDATLGNNIIGKPHSVTVCDPSKGTDTDCNSSGTKVGQTTFGYDEGTLIGTTNLPQHNAITGSRGNLTSVHRWLNTTGGTLNTSSTFDDAGQVQTATDVNGNTTSFQYACNDAYVSQVTLPATSVAQVSSATYDCNTGLTLTATDRNGQITSFAYDEILRPTQTTFADNGQTTISYPNANQVVTQSKIDSTRSTYSTRLVDGYGRVSRTAVANGETTPYDQQDFCYNSNGMLGFQSYPYQGSTPLFGTAKVCSGAGDSFSYDALGRTTQVTHSDGNSSTISYTGRATLSTDEGNGSLQPQRILQKNGLGRLAVVCEVSSTKLLGSAGTPAACNLDTPGTPTGFLTTYGYDLLGNLTSVAQPGVAARTYVYDSVSRATSSTDPESGTTTFGYTNGNLTSRTDARGITTTYQYDVLNRLTQKSFSDGVTPAANFGYDQAPTWGNPTTTGANVVGRLSEIYTTPMVSAAIFGYDAVGRVNMNHQCTPTNCGKGNWPLDYTYDLLGDMTSASNGVLGVTFSYSYNIAGRLTGMTSTANDAQHPPTLLSNVQYSPAQVTATLGNNVLETTNFSPRGMLTSYLANAPNGTPGTGSVAISGTLQQQTQPAVSASASVTIGGGDHSKTFITRCPPRSPPGCEPSSTIYYDNGKVFIAVNGHEYDYFFGAGGNSLDSVNNIAQQLVNAIQSDGGRVVNASVGSGGNIVVLTAGAGSAGNSISFTTGQTSDTFTFPPGPAFTASPTAGNLTGGQDAVTTIDNGSTTITVNGHPDTYSWSGSTTTAASIAQGLCNTINGDTAAFASASTNSTNGIWGECPLGSTTVALYSRNSGQNFPLAASSSSVLNSFSVSCPGFSNCASASLTGGGSPAYSFTLTPAPDGQITAANDLVNGKWSFAYDEFNRLASSNKNSGQQTSTYDYDPSGNRLHQNSNQGPAPQFTVDSNNHINSNIVDNNNNITSSAVTYDLAGDVVNDGFGNTFVWDAEGRLLQVKQGSTVIASYTYGADGKRVEAPNGDYVYDLAGRMVTQISPNGNIGEIYAGGHLATYSGGTTNFFHSDWLGTKRVMTAVNGVVSQTCTSLYFGDGVHCTGTINWSNNGFTDDIFDSETNLDHTLFRKYSSTQGRWISPDPYSGSENPADPQSWNRYTYVENNATNASDPLGLYCPTYRAPGIFCLAGNLSTGFFPDAFDNVPGPGGFGFDFGISLGGIPSPGVVNCLVPGACPNIPFPSLDQQIQAWLAGLLNPGKDCPMGPLGTTLCGSNSFVGNDLAGGLLGCLGGLINPCGGGLSLLADLLDPNRSTGKCAFSGPNPTRFPPGCAYGCAMTQNAPIPKFWERNWAGVAIFEAAELDEACGPDKFNLCPSTLDISAVSPKSWWMTPFPFYGKKIQSCGPVPPLQEVIDLILKAIRSQH